MAERLAGKSILITGATGIAAATARLACAEGAQVFVATLREDDGRALGMPFLAGDLSEPDAAGGAVEGCVSQYGRLDALFHVAGISGRSSGDGPIDACTDEGWDMVVRHNLRAAFLVARAAVRRMLAQEPPGGAILLMSSVLAFSPEPEFFATHAYAASRGAVIALSRAMAAHYASRGIRVNSIAPGLTRTPMSARAQSDPAIGEFLKAKQPLARGMLDPDDIARAALFLLSDDARHVTGQVLAVDGGWTSA
ncbi:MAG: SDR family NAD(P)-dependent oxidoreductase [Bryobacteraceae bacterium]